MSGTSLDGVDYALCDISPGDLRLRKLWSVKFPLALRARLHEAARGEARSWAVAQLHHDLGRFYAARALAGIGRVRPQIVGLHGQTIFHSPNRKAPATFQIGEPAYLAEALRVPVVSNFRAGDLAAGGQGAPLATVFHVRAFGQRGRHVCVNNLGGISNVTSIDWRRGREPQVRAFDTGPANVLIDLAMRELSGGRLHFDRGGRCAARGRVCDALLKRWLRHSFFLLKPPKSTGRELFGESFFKPAFRQARDAGLAEADVVASFTAFTARSLAMNYRLHLPGPPDLVVLAGGGASNPVLRRMVLEELLRLNHQVEVRASAELGWLPQSVEPAAFALLAWLRMNRRAGNLPITTGASAAVLLGQVTEFAL